MTTASVTSPAKIRPRGRGLFWAGIGLCLLGIALTVVQYNLLGWLMVPWYSPILATLGAGLLLYAVVQRRSVSRIIGLCLVAALAGFQWYMLGFMAKLPDYQGPARVGQKLPPFQTTLADGRQLTERELQDGTASVLVFYRGRW